MTKMLRVAIISLLLLSSAASADYLEEAWNFRNVRVFGKVKEVVVIDELREQQKRVEYYNEKGQKTKIEEYSGKGGKLISKFTFEYNKDGDLFRASLFDGENESPGFVATAEYAAKGVIGFIAYKFIEDEKERTFKTKPFEYDEKKRLKSFKVKPKDDLIACDYKFDDKGNCTEYIFDVGDKKRSETKYGKYHKGVPQIIKGYSNGKMSTSVLYKYKFDKAGNWTEKVSEMTFYTSDSKDKKPKTIKITQKRTITYYPEKNKLD